MRRESFLVTDDGSTPDKPLERCIYCSAPVNTEHGKGCVMRRRTVVLRATVEFVAVVPEDWGEDDIDCRYNQGTWCMNNLPDLLEEHVGGWDSHRCLCGSPNRIEFVQDACADDEARSAISVGTLVD